LTSPDVWYETLDKPSFNPPNWVFAPVWTVLFVLIGVALYIVWDRSFLFFRKKLRTALNIFAIQIMLNILWSWLFFYFRNPTLAFVEIVMLLAVIIWNMFVFYRIDRRAGFLILPYAVWVSFAMVLNATLVILN